MLYSRRTVRVMLLTIVIGVMTSPEAVFPGIGTGVISCYGLAGDYRDLDGWGELDAEPAPEFGETYRSADAAEEVAEVAGPPREVEGPATDLDGRPQIRAVLEASPTR